MKRITVASSTLILMAVIMVQTGLAQDPNIPGRPTTQPTTPPLKPEKSTSNPADRQEPSQPSSKPRSDLDVDKPEMRPEVIVAEHAIGLVEEKTKDKEARDAANKLLNEEYLSQIKKTLNKQLGPGDEFLQADRFNKLLKEIDKNFKRADEQDVRAWLMNTEANPKAMNAPWPLCLIKGCG